MQRLSVIITNYNYERFVGAAVESALALAWPDVEVVVVDDGSTDGSLEVLRGFGTRIRLLATSNAGQRVAANRGFAMSTGDVVVFLDSDDLLPPGLPAALDAAITPQVSKVQLQVQRVDEHGKPAGRPFPEFDPPPSPEDVRRWLLVTSAYPTAPGSGNAYARWFLDRVMPVGAEVGAFIDSALLASAPLLGDVVSLPGVVVHYRRHGANDSNLMADSTRFPREVERARARWQFALRAAANESAGDRALFRSRELLQLRVAASRLAPQTCPLPGDSRVRMAADAVRSPLQPGPEPPLRRVVVAGWCLATLLAPVRLAQRLVALRYGAAR